MVYLARNTVNGMVYVGATGGTLEFRKKIHKASGKLTRKTKLGRAIAEYGFEKFQWSVLAECSTDDELFAKEEMFVVRLNSLDELTGYNSNCGSNGRRSRSGGPFFPSVSRTVTFSAEEDAQIADAAKRNERSFSSELRSRCRLGDVMPAPLSEAA